MSGQLILSLFPGIGMLDRAFEEEGFCVVRGPDALWGGDVGRFHPPAGRFDGVIGGPPCQAHSTFAHLNRHRGQAIAPDLTPEFARCVAEARPSWWLMENVPAVPDLALAGYRTTRFLLNARWLGMEQSRLRAFQFGTPDGRKLDLGEHFAALEHIDWSRACLASEGRSGMSGTKRKHQQRVVSRNYHKRRELGRFAELQGLPPDFLADAPFTIVGKYRVIGNGVPMPMGRALAKAVRRALDGATQNEEAA